jgi:SecD/SecF fusion protein
VYTIDEIFVQDRLWWKLAQWNDWSPLNGAYFTIAKSETTQLWEPCVGIEFNGKWKEIFCEVTTNNLGKSMGIFIWGQAVTIATIQAKICDWRAQISGGFDKERAINTAKELNSWNMPAPLILLQEEKVSPSLWDSAFEGALIATLVWVLAIILYIFFIYGWRKAIVTASTMIMFFVVLLAFLKLIDYALSLSGIAAIILSIWMAVDANILIFERMNEEVREWKTYLSAVKTASKRSWSAIRDGQISTLLIWVLLFAYGINMFKWFGSMIVLTALLTLIINVPFITDMLEIMYQNKKD